MLRQMFKQNSLLAATLAASFAVGCGGSGAKATDTKTPATFRNGSTGSETVAGATKAAPGPGIISGNLHVDDEIARACGLTQTETKSSFDFDSSQIGDEDRTLLAAVARCLVEGALRGRGVALVGRADPRGEEEYNLSLGEARATAVRRYLKDLGVQEERLRATSRGKIDATGTDEAGWAKDRRVDIQLL